jgi:uncharacterized membrane protein
MSPTNGPAGRRWAGRLAVILAVAAGLRGYQLGRASFWYDEVVTMRLARAGGPAPLLGLLSRIDATRAPLHPLLLEGWIGVFGISEAAARSLSVLCGLATVGLIFAIGRSASDIPTGLWAAWLAAFSPVLIVYSREARMYAWLVMVSCFCWWILLELRRSYTKVKAVAYILGLVALVYSHPLGLIMLATLTMAAVLGMRACFGSWKRWLAVHFAAGVLVLPWVANYLDHAPEFLSGPLPLRFLLGTPIGYIGGNFATLAGMIVLMAWGLRRLGKTHQCEATATGFHRPPQRLAPSFLLLWLIVPPLTLYAYSRLFQPIFGPPRYTVYSAPAFLILLALGLTRLPGTLRHPIAIALTILAAWGLKPLVYDPDLKADWRTFATDLASRSIRPAVVIVAPPGQGTNVEIETARYYLPDGCEAIPLDESTAERLGRTEAASVFLAVGSRRGRPVIPPPDRIGPCRFRPDRTYPGLTTLRAEHGTSRSGL